MYREVADTPDVSSVKELCKRWFPSIEKLNKRQRGGIESSHR